MIVGYVIGARNLTDRTETTIVERKVDQNPERIIGVAREPQPPLPRETSSNTGYLYNSDMLRGEFLSLQMTCPGDSFPLRSRRALLHWRLKDRKRSVEGKGV